MKIIFQLLKEFWLPLLIGLVWTAYNILESPTHDWSFRNFVNIFGPTFFFVSWLVAQWFRVKKQQGVEKGLGIIERNIKKTLTKLDATATQISGHITGGDSVCYFLGPSTRENTWKNIAIIHCGAYPLYDVVVRVCDIDKFKDLKDESIQQFPHPEIDQIVKLGNLIPEHVRFSPISLSLGQSDYKRFNIFFTARNGSFTQLLRCKRVDGEWFFATRITRGNNIVLENIDEKFLQDASEVFGDD